LGVFDAAGGAGVLALCSDRMHTLFEVTGFVKDENGVRVAERVDDVSALVA
jgi:hypothetical protein